MTADLNKLAGILKPRLTKFIPHKPTIKQTAFLLVPQKEALFGGAAGGGKSDALLMAALQYVDVPGYAALLMRKTLADLKLPNALLSRATEWLTPYLRVKDVRYSASDHAFYFKTFDSKGKRLQDSSVTFGYIGDANAYSRYQGIELQMVGYDEVTQHSEQDYTYLFSRLRKCNCPDHKLDYDPECHVCRMMASLPIRMRGTTNPGGVGHRWVQKRFKIEPVKQLVGDREVIRWIGKDPNRPFIPSFLHDNPFLNQEEYTESLSNLTEEHRAQLQDGDWGFVANARFQQKYQRFFSESGDLLFLGPNRTGTHLNWQRDIAEVFQTIDSASSLTEGPGDTDFNPKYNPSWTVISTWALTKCYNLLWLHMERFREEIPEVIDRMWEQYYRWRPSKVIIEENGIGKGVVQYANRLGMVVEGVFKDTDKLRDATVAIIQMKNGRIWFPQYGDWIKDAENEIFTWQGYPNETDDIVDTLSRACNYVKWHNVMTKPESYHNRVCVEPYDLPGVFKPTHPLY